MVIYICKFCSISYETKNSLSQHTYRCKDNPDKKITWSKGKNKENCLSIARSIDKRKKTIEANILNGKTYPGKPHTIETKLKLSIKRKKFLKDNSDKHPWKSNNKFISGPCENAKNYLRSKNISFVDEYCPLQDRLFSIDIAFPDIKFGIEINGNQHYDSDGNLLEYYQNRHDLIVKQGWTLVELHYVSVVGKNVTILDSIIEDRVQPDYTEYFIEKSKKSKCKTTKENILQRRQEKYNGKWKDYPDKFLNSNIDFSKFGWVQEVSKILGITTQNVNKWMKRMMPEFYSRCYRRKFYK